MNEIAAVLGDEARWRIVGWLAERPRSVGELVELTGLRQPQTTKHLQALARAGVVSVAPLGQKRVYALEAEPLREFGLEIGELVRKAEAQAGERDVLARYQAALDAETAAAVRERWADGREFSFERLVPAPPDVVWRYWVEPEKLATWWAPPSLAVVEVVLDPRPHGDAVLEFRDAEGRYRSEGHVQEATENERLVFDLAVLGDASYTAEYDLELDEVPEGTRLRLGLRITDTTVEAAPAIAGIETGWGQVLDNLTETIKGAQR
ncbi:metalloregulator ArsR/SmtB family transcription factor [Amycolatopsis sp. FDAARGOS 1241]|uniref:metalloregulator ArsR/SmtB family transcription factor n=1 Tax=Amycolatopsis sp. FDAARGOS 1241 TaxID=2778070 RepID=UPI0019502B24|nr:metalloregulator ArsR/SmtB family transcription factor [Amycolatopsis sp. FDAARGOS 1241]QRP45646.1 metalloregulator ArsR/SmtB family transcription factor [Amycolatopsis sp. FDAARGOS 1241]